MLSLDDPQYAPAARSPTYGGSTTSAVLFLGLLAASIMALVIVGAPQDDKALALDNLDPFSEAASLSAPRQLLR